MLFKCLFYKTKNPAGVNQQDFIFNCSVTAVGLKPIAIEFYLTTLNLYSVDVL